MDERLEKLWDYIDQEEIDARDVNEIMDLAEHALMLVDNMSFVLTNIYRKLGVTKEPWLEEMRDQISPFVELYLAADLDDEDWVLIATEGDDGEIEPLFVQPYDDPEPSIEDIFGLEHEVGCNCSKCTWQRSVERIKNLLPEA